jgi:hypothetical protein
MSCVKLCIGVEGQGERLKCYMQISKVYLVSKDRRHLLLTPWLHMLQTGRGGDWKREERRLKREGCAVWNTVTRIDAIFRYPDRVPLTHFVHRAKKVFGMWALIFC